VLKTHGGVYFDVDIELIRDISPLLGNSAFLGEELPGRLNTAVLGSEASGGYVEACASEMLNRHKNGKSFLIAPELATHVYKTLCNDVTVFSTEHFYPYNPYDSEGVGQLMIADIKENTYAVHHWGKSWNESFIAKLARKAKKIYAA
jgi:mannosyltransferase OCH1-like enzyme